MPPHPYTPKITFFSVVKCPNRVICSLVPPSASAHQLPHLWALPGCNFTDFWHCREAQVHPTLMSEHMAGLKRHRVVMAQAIVQSCSGKCLVSRSKGTVDNHRLVTLHTSGWWRAWGPLLEPPLTVQCQGLPMPLLFPRHLVPLTTTHKSPRECQTSQKR